MREYYFIGFLIIIQIACFSQTTINISGTYLDKKDNPINEAHVEYLTEGSILYDDAITGSDGFFTIELLLTSTTENFTHDPIIPFPNPFSGCTEMNVSVPENSIFYIYDNQGQLIIKTELNCVGTWNISWGGLNENGKKVEPGIYYFLIAGKDYQSQTKVIFSPGEKNACSLSTNLIDTNKNTKLKSTKSNDLIRFTKENTSLLEIDLLTPTQDTSLGIFEGNAGPINVAILNDVIHIDSLESWNLNQYFYNDDQSVYTSDNVYYEIVDDSLIIYTGTTAGTFNFTVLATDINDPLLITNMDAQVEITNTSYFSISGNYLDNVGNPFENALVIYLQDGTIDMGQTNSLSDGSYFIQLAVDPDDKKSLDLLQFTKPNTTTIGIELNTPLQDTLISVTGNLGPTVLNNIDETHFDIEDTLTWNLNTFFYNDSPQIYSVSGNNNFEIVNDTILKFVIENTGTFIGQVTATDLQDSQLTATFNASTIIQWTYDMVNKNIFEDQIDTIVIANLNQYTNPAFTGTIQYEIINQTNPQLVNLYITDTILIIDSLQSNGYGNTVVEIQLTDENDNTTTANITVNVIARPDINGNITDFLTDSIAVGANVKIWSPDSILWAEDLTDENGNYHLQINTAVYTTSYFPVLITKNNYTPRHTWATVHPDTLDIIADYNIVIDTFNWLLYDEGWRTRIDGYIPGHGIATMHWNAPPTDTKVFTDNTAAPGWDLTDNANTAVYNLQNILPGFNPRDAIPGNVQILDTMESYDIGEFFVYWDDNTLGGAYAMVEAGPEIIKGLAKFNPIHNPTEPDNRFYNQEFGSVMGTTYEPFNPSICPQNSVFCNTATVQTFTLFDIQCGKLYLNRSRGHYNNENEDGVNRLDWDLRPDLVEYYYDLAFGNKKNNKADWIFTYKIINEDGSKTSESYPYLEIPIEVMEMFKPVFKDRLEKLNIE